MNIYCFECGTPNSYTYSSGKPEKCYKCHSDFALKASQASASAPVAPVPIKAKKINTWKQVKLADLFTISIEDGYVPPSDHTDENAE